MFWAVPPAAAPPIAGVPALKIGLRMHFDSQNEVVILLHSGYTVDTVTVKDGDRPLVEGTAFGAATSWRSEDHCAKPVEWPSFGGFAYPV